LVGEIRRDRSATSASGPTRTGRVSDVERQQCRPGRQTATHATLNLLTTLNIDCMATSFDARSNNRSCRHRSDHVSLIVQLDRASHPASQRIAVSSPVFEL